MTDVSTMAKWATVAEHGDEMAAAYKALYGVEWTEDPAAADGCLWAGSTQCRLVMGQKDGSEPPHRC